MMRMAIIGGRDNTTSNINDDVDEEVKKSDDTQCRPRCCGKGRLEGFVMMTPPLFFLPGTVLIGLVGNFDRRRSRVPKVSCS